MKSKVKLILVLVAVLVVTAACSLGNAFPKFNFDVEIPEFNLDGILSTPEDSGAVTIPTSLPPASSSNPQMPQYADLNGTLESLYEVVSPGVVSIQFASDNGSGLGSGFVIDKEGHIVTNYHVVEDVSSLEVHFPSGLKVYGEVIGTDLDSDLAVVKVDVDPDLLMPLAIGDSDNARVGQTVVAIGNPYGLSGTMTQGIISARGRVLDSIRQTSSGTFFSAGDLIQTDTSINPGNSGGPLLNLNGEVIGINRAIQTSGMTITGESVNTGIGFAVSSNILRRVVPSLIANGSYEYPYLGLSSLNSLSLNVAETLGLPRSTGAYIVDVIAGGPSDEAGLRAGTRTTAVNGLYSGGDLIIAADGQPMLQFSDLLTYMVLNKVPGDTITFTIIRNGEEMSVPVVLGSRQ